MTTRRPLPPPCSPLIRLIAALVLVAAIDGCYTLVRHPGVRELNYLRPPADKPCTSCHTPAQHLAFVSSQRLDRPRGPWGALAHPWWFHDAPDSARSRDATH